MHATRFIFLLYVMLFALVAQAQGVEVSTDHPRADYQAGETATFRVESARRGQLEWEIRHNMRSDIIIASGSVAHTQDVSEIPFTFASPTFVTFKARIDGVSGEAAATFSRNEITALTSEPADYDAFWQEQKDLLAAIPMDVRVWTQSENDLAKTYEFSCAQIDGRRVYGYMVIPKGTGPFPATLRLPSYGRGRNLVQPDDFPAERANCITLSINIHDVPPDQEAHDGYEPNIVTSPETIYHRYSILGAIRAIDYLATRPEWNGTELCVYGESQGGGLGMLLAGIDGRPTHLMQSVGAMSQHAGERFGLPSGFPYYLDVAASEYGSNTDSLDAAFEATKYYDAIFAARRFHGPSLHFANYLDEVCPPATAYAARNAMGGPKVTLHSLRAGHGSVSEFVDQRREFFREHFDAANHPPFEYESHTRGHFVNAGPSLSVPLDTAISLGPSYGYDRQFGSGWEVEWELVDGPGHVAFANAANPFTTVRFSNSGEYRLRVRITDPYPQEDDKFYELVDDVVVQASVRTGVDTTNSDVTNINDPAVWTQEAGEGFRDVAIGPNPVSDHLQIEATFAQASEYTLRIVSLRGEQLFKQNYPARALVNSQLDFSGFAAGTYGVIIETEFGAVTLPVVHTQ